MDGKDDGSVDKATTAMGQLKDAADAKRIFPILSWTLAEPDFSGYLNESGGWADASKAITQLRDECLSLGVSFISGRAGTVVGFDSDVQGTIRAALTLKGAPIYGDHFVLAAGAWASSLVDMYNSTLSTAQALAYLCLTESEMRKYKDIPIYSNFSTGWFNFPPMKTRECSSLPFTGGDTPGRPPKGTSQRTSPTFLCHP